MHDWNCQQRHWIQLFKPWHTYTNARIYATICDSDFNYKLVWKASSSFFHIFSASGIPMNFYLSNFENFGMTFKKFTALGPHLLFAKILGTKWREPCDFIIIKHYCSMKNWYQLENSHEKTVLNSSIPNGIEAQFWVEWICVNLSWTYEIFFSDIFLCVPKYLSVVFDFPLHFLIEIRYNIHIFHQWFEWFYACFLKDWLPSFMHSITLNFIIYGVFAIHSWAKYDKCSIHVESFLSFIRVEYNEQSFRIRKKFNTIKALSFSRSYTNFPHNVVYLLFTWYAKVMPLYTQLICIVAALWSS